MWKKLSGKSNGMAQKWAGMSFVVVAVATSSVDVGLHGRVF
jgi:hypothetical protein